MSYPTLADEQAIYASVDPTLMAWAERHGIKFIDNYKDYAVRTIWLEGQIQIWVEEPDKEGYVKVVAAELTESLPSKWGRRFDIRLPVAETDTALDEAWAKAQSWL